MEVVIHMVAATTVDIPVIIRATQRIIPVTRATMVDMEATDMDTVMDIMDRDFVCGSIDLWII